MLNIWLILFREVNRKSLHPLNRECRVFGNFSGDLFFFKSQKMTDAKKNRYNFSPVSQILWHKKNYELCHTIVWYIWNLLTSVRPRSERRWGRSWALSGTPHRSGTRGRRSRAGPAATPATAIHSHSPRPRPQFARGWDPNTWWHLEWNLRSIHRILFIY